MRGALLADLGRIAAEQLRQHLAHDTGHVIAIVVEIGQPRHAAHARGLLELVHAARHHFDAALNRDPLLAIQAVGHPDHALHVGHQLVLRVERLIGQLRHEVPSQRIGRLLPVQHGNEALQEVQACGG